MLLAVYLQCVRIQLCQHPQDTIYRSVRKGKRPFLWNCGKVLPYYWLTAHKAFLFISCVLIACFRFSFLSFFSSLIYCVSHIPFNHIYIDVYLYIYLFDNIVNGSRAETPRLIIFTIYISENIKSFCCCKYVHISGYEVFPRRN
jgi:hypothetical protein